MFSPVKAIIAGALVFTLGGVFLIAQPFDQQAQEAADPTAAVPGVLGAVFVEPHGADPATYRVFVSDGTVFSFDPYYGPGVGLWEPDAGGGLVSAVVHADVDSSVAGEERGQTIVRSSGTYDPEADSLSLSWEATLEPAGGGARSTLDGTSTAVRRVMAPMPPDASATTPPDEGWQPVLGPGRYDGGRGSVGVGSEGETWSIRHADGTGVDFNPYVGDGIGLWAPAGSMLVASGWWAPEPPEAEPLVSEGAYDAETGVTRGRYGMSEGFSDVFTGTALWLEALEAGGAVPAAPDPAAWPDRGSVWVQAVEGGSPALMVLHADGTLAQLDPNLVRVASAHPGPFVPLSDIVVAAGIWQPTEGGGLAFTIQYREEDPSGATSAPGVTTLAGEGFITDGGESLTYDYRSTWQRSHSTAEPQVGSGTATATRFHLEPSEEG